MAAPLPLNEAKRLAALNKSRLLDTEPEDVYDDIVRLTAFTFNAPIAAMCLIDEHRQWFKSILGLSLTEVPREAAFCAHTILDSDILVLQDTQADPRFADNPAVTGAPYVRFYAGVPLVTKDGYALGSLFIIDRIPRTLTTEQVDAFKTLARQIMGWMELAQAEDKVRQREERLAEVQRIARIGNWEMDVATQRLTWSAEMFRLLGYTSTHEEPSYDQVQAQYHPDDQAERDRLYARALATGEPYRCDLRLILPNGIYRCCHIVGRPDVDAGGVVTRITGTLQDITERMEREQQIKDAKAILEAQKAQLEVANAELETVATTDPLTGLLNHQAFHARLAKEIVRAQHTGVPMAVAILDLDGFRFFNDVHGHEAGDTILRQVGKRLREVFVTGEVIARFGGDEFIVLFPNIGGEITPAAVETRLRMGLIGLYHRLSGEVTAVPITAAVGAAVFPQVEAGDQAAYEHVSGGLEVLRQAEERLWQAKTGSDADTEAGRVRAHALRSLSGFSMLDALVTAVDNKDRYTRRHSEDVLDYSLMIAREMGLTEAEQRTVAVAALLHDVGKIGIPDAILRKPGKLDADEYEAVRQHPQMGALIVQAVPGLEEILDVVCHHHERWDGRGYPFGLVGTETPFLARLMAVADAFSAMTTDRPYRQGMDRRKALTLLEAGAGTQWDRRCVDAFLISYLSNRGVGIGS